jgi:hypothetical protein
MAVQHLTAVTLLLLVLGACRPETPRPPLGTHDGEIPSEVPFPPPVPRVEELEDPPSPTAVWVDGHWVWDGGGYAWTDGSWIEPPPGAVYAPPTLVRRRNGELVYYGGVWKRPSPTESAP